MKNVLFFISFGLSLILIISVVTKVISDLDQLTRYGFGYLAGQVILIGFFSFLMYLTGRKKIHHFFQYLKK